MFGPLAPISRVITKIPYVLYKGEEYANMIARKDGSLVLEKVEGTPTLTIKDNWHNDIAIRYKKVNPIHIKQFNRTRKSKNHPNTNLFK